jgi:hypothetical protein
MESEHQLRDHPLYGMFSHLSSSKYNATILQKCSLAEVGAQDSGHLIKSDGQQNL